MTKKTPKPKTPPAGDREQAAKLAAHFGDDAFTVAEAAPALGLKGAAANLTAGRVLKKLADAGLIDRSVGNTFVAGSGHAGTRPAEPEAEVDSAPADADADADADAAEDDRPRTTKVRKQIEPPTPVKKMTRADRKALLDANLPEGVGLSERTAEGGDTLE